MADLQQKRKISERELEKAKPRIGQPCEHHMACPSPSEYAMGDWYPQPGNYVYCARHIRRPRGAAVFPVSLEASP